MTELKDMEAHAEKLLGQLAAESKYLDDLKKEVLKEIYDLDHGLFDKAEKDLKDEEKIVRRSLGRTERYVNREEKKEEDDVKELEGCLPAKLVKVLKDIDTKLHVGLNTLVQGLSRSRGKLRQDIDEAKKLFTAKDNAGAKAKADATVKDIDYILKMVWGTEVEEKKYIQFLKYLETL